MLQIFLVPILINTFECLHQYSDPEEEALEDLLGLDGAAEAGGEVGSFFDDDETRGFYQDLPDLTKYLTSAAKRENALHLEKEVRDTGS